MEKRKPQTVVTATVHDLNSTKELLSILEKLSIDVDVTNVEVNVLLKGEEQFLFHETEKMPPFDHSTTHGTSLEV